MVVVVMVLMVGVAVLLGGGGVDINVRAGVVLRNLSGGWGASCCGDGSEDSADVDGVE